MLVLWWALLSGCGSKQPTQEPNEDSPSVRDLVEEIEEEDNAVDGEENENEEAEIEDQNDSDDQDAEELAEEEEEEEEEEVVVEEPVAIDPQETDDVIDVQNFDDPGVQEIFEVLEELLQ
jgi:hypothetical protein